MVLEALAAGCHLFATDIASFPELILNKKNGWLVRAPTSALTGDTFITEFGNIDYYGKYLNTLSMHQIEDDIAEWMMTFVRKPGLARSMMKVSHELYEQKYSLSVWNDRMRRVVLESFPELGVLET